MTVFIANGGTKRVGGKHTKDIFNFLIDFDVANVLVVTYALEGKSGWLAKLWKKPSLIVNDKRFNFQTASWSDTDEQLAAQLTWADGILIVGGDPATLYARLQKRISKIPKHIKAVAGISAGAMCFGKFRIQGGADSAKLTEAMGWIKNVVIDVHVAERGREGRVIAISQNNPKLTVLGLNEYSTILLNSSGKLLEESPLTPHYYAGGKKVS